MENNDYEYIDYSNLSISEIKNLIIDKNYSKNIIDRIKFSIKQLNIYNELAKKYLIEENDNETYNKYKNNIKKSIKNIKEQIFQLLELPKIEIEKIINILEKIEKDDVKNFTELELKTINDRKNAIKWAKDWRHGKLRTPS